MSRRKFRPILLEVASRDRAGLRSRSAEGDAPVDDEPLFHPPRSAAAPRATPATPPPAHPPDSPATQDTRAHRPVGEPPEYVPSLAEALNEFRAAVQADWRPPAIVGGAIALLLLLSFQLGRLTASDGAQAPSNRSGDWTDAPAVRGSEREPDAELERGLPLPPVTEPTPTDLTADAGATPAPAAAAEPQSATPLKRGFHYLVVQHFPKSKRSDADAAAKYLTDAGIATAVIVGAGDLEAVVLEPFLIQQPDAAAARAERMRAEALTRQVLALGRKYQQAGGGYNFSGCRPRLE